MSLHFTRRHVLGLSLAGAAVGVTHLSSASPAHAAPTMAVQQRHRNAYSSVAVGESITFRRPGSNKFTVALTVLGEENALQILDADTGGRLFTTQLPQVATGAKDLTYHAQSGHVIVAGSTHLWAVDVTTGQLSSTVTITDAQQLYDVHAAADGAIWVGSYPDAALRRATISSTGQLTTPVRVVQAGGASQYVKYPTTLGTKVAFSSSVADCVIGVYDTATQTLTQTSIPQAHQGAYTVKWVDADRIAVGYSDSSGAGRMDILRPSTGQFQNIPDASGYHALTGTIPGGESTTFYVAKFNAILEIDAVTARIVQTRSFPYTVSSLFAETVTGEPYAHVVMHDQTSGAWTYVRNNMLRWTRAMTAELAIQGSALRIQSITPIGAEILIGGYQGNGLQSLTMASGAPHLWTGNSGAQVESACQLTDGRIVFGSYNSATIHISGADRVARRIAQLRTTYQQSRPRALVESGGKIYVGSVADFGLRGGGVFELDPAGAVTRAWRDIIPEQSVVGLARNGSGSLIGATSLFGGYGTPQAEGEPTVFRLELSTGQLRWSTKIPGATVANDPIVVGSNIYVCSRSRVFRLDPNTGAITATWTVGSAGELDERYASAFLDHVTGSLLVHHAAGTLTTLDTSSGTVTKIGSGSYDLLAKSSERGSFFVTENGTDLVEFTIS